MRSLQTTAASLLLLCFAVIYFCCVISLKFPVVFTGLTELTALIEKDADTIERYQTSRAKIILFWTPFWTKHGLWNDTFSEQLNAGCAVSNCLFTYDRSQLDKADAVLFHLTKRDISAMPFPKRRPSGQVWVLFSIESPALKHVQIVNMAALNGLFNWTMSYRWDSDVPIPYGLVLPRYPLSTTVRLTSLPDAVQRTLPLRPSFERGKRGLAKTRLVTWMASNCNDVTSGRAKYVRELQKHIKVHTYGRCGNLTCGKRDTLRDLKDVNAPCERIISSSKFYLAFENAICPQYVTEKLFRTLTLGAVPVVLGGAKYYELLPDGSYIDALQYQPQQLAQLLLHLDRNDTAYQEFFRWQDSYSVINPKSETPRLICGLCRRLHELSPGEVVGSHDDLKRLYNPAQCFEWLPNQPLRRIGA